MMPLFPKRMHHFVDLFCGGANVAINIHAEGSMYGIDQQKEVIRLFNTLKTVTKDEAFRTIYEIIKEYRLSDSHKYGYATYNCNSAKGLASYNKERYIQLRKAYNERENDSVYYDFVFFVLTVYGFNNQIRFNRSGEFNIPVGKRDFNEKVQVNLANFINQIKEKDIAFICNDFRKIDFGFLSQNDFLYADPPYLISTATYNEQGGWTEREEKDLLELLDQLDRQGVKFALSNVLEHKGGENHFLKQWAKNYDIHYLNYHYDNSNYQIKEKGLKTLEVLITNY